MNQKYEEENCVLQNRTTTYLNLKLGGLHNMHWRKEINGVILSDSTVGYGSGTRRKKQMMTFIIGLIE